MLGLLLRFSPSSHSVPEDWCLMDLIEVAPPARHNRALLLGLMTAAGWDFYRNE